MKSKKLFRGISDKELKEFLGKGIPKGKRFTSDVFMARKYGKNIISVDFSDKKFKLDMKESDSFSRLKIKERYYKTKKPIKQFKKLFFLD